MKQHRSSNSSVKHHRSSNSSVKRHRSSNSSMKHYKSSNSSVKHHMSSNSSVKHHMSSNSSVKHHGTHQIITKRNETKERGQWQSERKVVLMMSRNSHNLRLYPISDNMKPEQPKTTRLTTMGTVTTAIVRRHCVYQILLLAFSSKDK